MLPTADEVTVRMNQEVSPVQVIARAKRNQGFTILNGSELLNVSAEDVPKYLVVQEGTTVRKGDPLLIRKGRFGRKQELVAPFSGILIQVRRGYLLFERRPKQLELRAMVPGRVSNLNPKRGASIKTWGTQIQGVWGSGREGYGSIKILTTSTKGVPSENDFHEARGAIIVAGHLHTEKLIEGAEAFGARGFIVGSVMPSVYKAARDYTIPVLVTDGIGQRPMTSAIYQLLREMEGQEASILARTTSGHRPELIIPRLDTVPDVDELPADIPLRRGQQVRILQPPFYSRIGTVVNVFNYPRSTPVGIKTSGANVALKDGQVVFIPKDNLDIII